MKKKKGFYEGFYKFLNSSSSVSNDDINSLSESKFINISQFFKGQVFANAEMTIE